MKKTNETISLIIPVYNEEKRIPLHAEKIIQETASSPERVELIFVDDGSTDQTSSLLKKIASLDPRTHLVSYSPNKGKGGAIAAGVAAASGDWIFFTDLDLSVPLTFLPAFLESLREGADLVIGSRRCLGAKIEIHQPWYREILGEIFRRFTRLLLLPRISDFTCGFKGFRGTVAQDIFSSLTIFRWGFDVELLYIARQRNYLLKELPVTWYNSDQTKVRLGRDVLGSLREVMTIRWNAWRGRYDSSSDR